MPGQRSETLAHALAFVLGFSAVFIVLGASVGLVGFIVREQLPWLRWVGGAILVVMGLHVAGVLRIPALYRELRLSFRPSRRFGVASSFLVGSIFGAGWTPCIGPILGAILLYASTTQTVGQGALLLTAYSLGLGVPFLIAALALDRVLGFLRRLNRQAQLVEWASGTLLVGMGFVVMFNLIGRLASSSPLGLSRRFRPGNPPCCQATCYAKGTRERRTAAAISSTGSPCASRSSHSALSGSVAERSKPLLWTKA